ncbi:MAG: hypothetical protein V4616_13515 [Bacteroidota bacterium]
MSNRKQLVMDMLKETPGDAFLIYALALEEHKEGDLATATARLESLRSTQPEYLGTYYQLGKFYEEATSVEQAIAIYEQGISLARAQKEAKAERELKEALFILQDDDDSF